MEYSLINYLWFFIIYAFIGWVLEVIFHGVTEGKFVNRGFLNGPLCPIYGFGMIILLYFLSPLAGNIVFLFIGSVLLTSALEFVVGFLLEKLFSQKWWDYADRPFNIKGYICLSFSIMWGIGAVFVLEIIHPFIYKYTSFFDNKIGNILLLLIICIAYLIADFVVTLIGILNINKRFKLLQKMADRLKIHSERIGKKIYKGVKKVIGSKDGKTKDLELELDTEKNVEALKLKEESDKPFEKKSYIHKRLEKSYPNIKEKLSKISKKDLDK